MKSLACLLLLLATAMPDCAADEGRQSQADDIREAVFRYQFDNNASGQQQAAKVYFLSVGTNATDPSDDFMKRFTDHKPPVRKVSASHLVNRRGVVDKKTDEKGLIFRVLDINWISDTEVQVAGGYYEAQRSSSSNTYTLKKEGAKWKVTKDKLDWIS